MYITYGSISFIFLVFLVIYYYKYKQIGQIGGSLFFIAVLFALLAGLDAGGIMSTSKKSESYYRRYVRPRTYRGRTDYDKYISCISEGGYWLDGMCSTVSLPGSKSLQQLPFYYYGYYPYGYPFYKQPRYWPRRKYQKRYGGYLNG